MPSIELGDLALNTQLDALLQYVQGELAELEGYDPEHDVDNDSVSDNAPDEQSESIKLVLSVETKRSFVYAADGTLRPAADRVIACQFAAARAAAQVLRNFYPEAEHLFNPLDNEPLMKALYDYIKHNVASVR